MHFEALVVFKHFTVENVDSGFPSLSTVICSVMAMFSNGYGSVWPATHTMQNARVSGSHV